MLKLKIIQKETGDMEPKLRYNIWNKRLRLWWHKLWIRENEFHQSLSFDLKAWLAMNEKEKDLYLKDLARRRQIAHDRDMASEDLRSLLITSKIARRIHISQQ